MYSVFWFPILGSLTWCFRPFNPYEGNHPSFLECLIVDVLGEWTNEGEKRKKKGGGGDILLDIAVIVFLSDWGTVDDM